MHINYFKQHRVNLTITSRLTTARERYNLTLQRFDVIYHVKYERRDHAYVGATATPLGPSSTRLKENQDNTPYSRRLKVHKATVSCCKI